MMSFLRLALAVARLAVSRRRARLVEIVIPNRPGSRPLATSRPHTPTTATLVVGAWKAGLPGKVLARKGRERPGFAHSVPPTPKLVAPEAPAIEETATDG